MSGAESSRTKSLTGAEPDAPESGRWIVAPILTAIFFVFAAWLLMTKSPTPEAARWERAEETGKAWEADDELKAIEADLAAEGILRAQCGGPRSAGGAKAPSVAAIYEKGSRAFPAMPCLTNGGEFWSLAAGGNGYEHRFSAGEPSEGDVIAWKSFLKNAAAESRKNRIDAEKWEAWKKQAINEEAQLAKDRLERGEP